MVNKEREQVHIAERRRFVINVFEAARLEMIKKGEEPSDREVMEFLYQTRGKIVTWMHLQHVAGKLMGKEYEKIRENVLRESEKPLGIRALESRIARELEKRYLEIDQDPERNLKFIDAIIF